MGRPTRRNVHGAAGARDRHATGAWREAADRARARAGVGYTTIYRWRDQMWAAALEALVRRRQPLDQAARARIRELEDQKSL